MKVAQYEVLGHEAKDMSVPLAPEAFGVRDDRNARLLVSHAAQRLLAFVDRTAWHLQVRRIAMLPSFDSQCHRASLY
jgi:hypothetical protein